MLVLYRLLSLLLKRSAERLLILLLIISIKTIPKLERLLWLVVLLTYIRLHIIHWLLIHLILISIKHWLSLGICAGKHYKFKIILILMRRNRLVRGRNFCIWILRMPCVYSLLYNISKVSNQSLNWPRSCIT